MQTLCIVGCHWAVLQVLNQSDTTVFPDIKNRFRCCKPAVIMSCSEVLSRKTLKLAISMKTFCLDFLSTCELQHSVLR